MSQFPNDTLPVLPFLHQAQPDRPNTVFPSTLAFKQALDSSTVAIQGVHNALITDLQDAGVTTGASLFLGAAPVSGVAGTTVNGQIINLKAQIDAIVGGSLPPGGITLPFLGADVKNMISMGGLF